MRRVVPLTLFAYGLLSAAAQPIPQSELEARLQSNRSLYGFFDNGADLVAQANASHTDVTREFSSSLSEAQCPDCREPDDADHFRVKQAVRESDLVAIGTVKQQLSALTPGHGFVYTDSEFVVQDVWSAEARLHVRTGSEVTVTAPGGTVTVDSHKITTTLETTNNLQADHRYLLFLKYIPASSSYQPVALYGFDITTNPVAPLRTAMDTPGRQYLKNPTNFIQALHSSTDHALREAEAR